MSNSPVKFIGAARAVVGSDNPGSTGGVFSDIRAARRERRLSRDNRKRALNAYKKNAAMSYKDRMRAGAIGAASINRPTDELSNAIPTVETNNSVDNTLAAAQDRSQMRDAGELTGIAAPTGFSTMSSDVLNTPPPIAPVQPQTPTYGVAGAAEAMFGTPLQRQMSMGSSLMKRACKYKNKK
jgi:hypothetical protein